MRKIKIISVIIICFFLCCCSRKTPVEDAFNNVQTSIVSIKDSLPEECKTEEVLKKFDELDWKREMAEQICQAKIKDTQAKYERVLWVLGFIILAFFAKNFIKK